MIIQLGKQAKQAAILLAQQSTTKKNQVLQLIAKALKEQQPLILQANLQDVKAAQENGLSSALIDRLTLTEDRIELMIQEIQTVIQLPDPIGQILEGRTVLSGLTLEKKVVPLGVIGVIYESRPNVTIDIAALCIKTGNCAILRGGKETLHTNQILIELIQKALTLADLPKNCIQAIFDPDRAHLQQLLKLDEFVDMIIPRGGNGLQKLCQTEATIPVILGGIGVCHLYVDKTADLEKSINVIINAKAQRPSTCNSLETLLIHEAVLSDFIPLLSQAMFEHKITLHADKALYPLLKNLQATVVPVTEEALRNEWLSLNLNVVVVKDLGQAVAHIREYGSQHSDGVLTESLSIAQQFVQQVDSAAVYVNCSTRFTDGAQFGLGSEVAVSTQKLHARGPMGLDALTTYKWIGKGEYLSRR